MHRHRHEARGKELTPRLRIFAGGQAGPHSAIVLGLARFEPHSRETIGGLAVDARGRVAGGIDREELFRPVCLVALLDVVSRQTRGHSPALPIPCPRRCDPNHPAVGIRPKPHGPVTGLSKRFGQARCFVEGHRLKEGEMVVQKTVGRFDSALPGRVRPSPAPVERWVSPLELRPLLQLALQERRDFRCRLFHCGE